MFVYCIFQQRIPNWKSLFENSILSGSSLGAHWELSGSSSQLRVSRYIFNFTYQTNLNLNNIIEAWCCSLPSVPLIVFCCVELPRLISFSSFLNRRCFSCQHIVWTHLTLKPLCILFSWKILFICWIICISWCCF